MALELIGSRKIQDGNRKQYIVDVFVDVDSLVLQLYRRARTSKKGKVQIRGGAVTLKVRIE